MSPGTAARRAWSLIAVVVVAAGTAAGVVAASRSHPAPAAAADTAAATSTATVVRADLATKQQFYGTLGYGASFPVTAATTGGPYTWLPAPGSVVRSGQRLYEVDGRAVPLLPGARPMWRTLAAGVPPGPDIAQLNSALASLGYGTGIGASTSYGWRSRAAVRRWQAARGVPVTGVVAAGEVVFGPAPLRVAAVQVALGAPAQAGEPLLTATATTRVVDLSVPVDQAYLIRRGQLVTVTLPDAVTQTPGTVVAVASVATEPGAADGGRAAQQPGGGPEVATVAATIRLTHPPAAVAGYSSAPVSVAVTTAQARGVLAVPVAALQAQPGGRYAVTVLDGGRRSLVPVVLGLASDTFVQVTGAGIRVGTRVEVPGS